MKTFDLPGETCQVVSTNWTAISLFRELILLLPYWKAESDVGRVVACLELEDSLDKVEKLPTSIEISNDTWGHLKTSMQLQNLQPIQNGGLNRLYMKIYRNVLQAKDAVHNERTK